MPHHAEKHPDKNIRISSMRQTIGTFEDGEKFCFVDDWRSAGAKNKELEKPWKGRTIFVETSAPARD